jgi:hypothetical protein
MSLHSITKPKLIRFFIINSAGQNLTFVNNVHTQKNNCTLFGDGLIKVALLLSFGMHYN